MKLSDHEFLTSSRTKIHTNDECFTNLQPTFPLLLRLLLLGGSISLSHERLKLLSGFTAKRGVDFLEDRTHAMAIRFGLGRAEAS